MKFLFHFLFNAENQITQMDGGAAAYGYDGEGRRMKKTVGLETVYYFYGPGGLLCEFTTTNTGATQASSTDRATYRTSDKLGSAVLTISAAGTVIENNRTLPYGESWLPEVASTNDKKFTTYVRDSESGLDYAMDRFDSNALGRFMSADRGRFAAYVPSTWNRYVYTANDPVNHVDTDGKFLVCREYNDPETGRMVLAGCMLYPVSPFGSYYREGGERTREEEEYEFQWQEYQVTVDNLRKMGEPVDKWLQNIRVGTNRETQQTLLAMTTLRHSLLSHGGCRDLIKLADRDSVDAFLNNVHITSGVMRGAYAATPASGLNIVLNPTTHPTIVTDSFFQLNALQMANVLVHELMHLTGALFEIETKKNDEMIASKCDLDKVR